MKETLCWLQCDRCDQKYPLTVLSFHNEIGSSGEYCYGCIDIATPFKVRTVFGHNLCDRCWQEYQQAKTQHDNEWNEFVKDWFREGNGNRF